MSFFSIVLPTYNRSTRVIATIKSVQDQSFQDWECIVVDDGSTDDTSNVVKKLAKEDPRIKYIYQDNAERSVARNNGIDHASGEYICLLDSDDFYKVQHLQMLYERIVKDVKPIAMYFTNQVELKDDVLTEVTFASLAGNQVEYLLLNSIIPARTCIHRDILSKEKFDEDIVIVEDAILWTRISINYPVYHIEEPSVIYAVHDDNSINGKNHSGIKRLKGLKTFAKRYKIIVDSLDGMFFRNLMSDAFMRVARDHIYNNEKLKGRYYLLRSILKNPFHKQTKHKVYIFLFWNKNYP
jgi:glycosyltransferase involved in cell wall biosynthesis